MSEDHERTSDAIIASLATDFKNFKDRYERDQEEAKEKERDDYEHTMRWRNAFKDDVRNCVNRLTAVESAVGPLITVGRALKWAFVISGGAMLTAGAKLGFAWVVSHFK